MRIQKRPDQTMHCHVCNRWTTPHGYETRKHGKGCTKERLEADELRKREYEIFLMSTGEIIETFECALDSELKFGGYLRRAFAEDTPGELYDIIRANMGNVDMRYIK